MSIASSKYEVVPHGIREFPIVIYSEKIYQIQPHHHKEYEIFYLEKGQMRFGLENEEFLLSAGDILLIEPNVTHYAYDIEEQIPHHFYSLVFDMEAFGLEADPCCLALQSIQINRFLNIPPSLLTNLEVLFSMTKKHDFGSEIMIKSFLFSVISYIISSKQYIKFSDLQNKKYRSSATVHNVICYIERHYRERITIDQIVGKLSYSKSHLMRLFKETNGLSFVDYLNKYRIEKSCLELLYTEKRISEIATNNGFNTVQYYSRIFKQFTDTTPGNYRNVAKSFQNPLFRV